MTNLDSLFKSRDITLPTKVHLVKAMVFPVVRYGCESWIIKKAECQRIYAFKLWCWRRLLRVTGWQEDPTSPEISRSVVSDSATRSKPGLPVHYQLLEFTQTHVHQVGDAIQLSHSLLSPSPSVFNLSQHQGLFI